MPLDRDPHFGQIAELRRRHQRHAHRTVRRDFQRPVGDEPRHRLSHRHDGDAKYIGGRPQRQFFARRKPARNQQIRQLRVSPLAESLAIERLDQIKCGRQIHASSPPAPPPADSLSRGTRQVRRLLQL
jgi:hypothetical protein